MRRYQLIPATALQTLLITSTSPLPGGTVGVAYSFSFNAIGGVAPYTWTETGALPSGLTLASSGTLSGTPGTTFSGSIVVKVTDSVGSQFSATFSLSIAASTLNITTSSPLPAATQSIPYSFTMSATGGAPPYAWSLTSQTGSNGWSVSSAGVVTGTPATLETDTLLIKVVDSVATPSSANFNLTVSASVGRFLSMNASGQILNQSGTPIMLRGVNLTGLENQLAGALAGGFQSTVWGNFSSDGTQTTSERGPSFPAIGLWQANFVRVLLNGNSFLNCPTAKLTDPSGTGNVATAAWTNLTTSDAAGRYRPALQDAIDGARSINCYALLVYHTASPSFTLGGTTAFTYATGQPPFMCYDSAFPFWCGGPGVSMPCYLASVYGSAAFNTANGITALGGALGAAGPKYNSNFGGPSGIDDIIFELFNEPYLNAQGWNMTKLNPDGTDSGVACPVDPVTFGSSFAFGTSYTMINGGWVNYFWAQGADVPGTFKSPANTSPPVPAGHLSNAFTLPWRVLGYQTVVNALRAQGFDNILSVSTQQFTNTTRQFPYCCPVDTLSPPRIAETLHSYPTAYNSPTSVPALSDGGATWHTFIDQMFAGTLAYTPPSWTTGWSNGRVVPIINDEWGDAAGINCTASSQYDLQLLNYCQAATTGLYHTASFNWTGPNLSTSGGSNNGGPAGTYQWQLDAHVAANTVTAVGSISGFILTVTGAPTGGTIQAGMIFLTGQQLVTGHLNDGTWIKPYGTSGTTGVGGVGTYAISNSQTVGAGSTFTFGMPVPLNGHGTTVNTWMLAAPGPL